MSIQNKFETNTCPLCGNVLKMQRSYGVTTVSCPTINKYHNGEEKSHYEVEFDKTQGIQHMYVGSWGIDNFLNGTRSRVYKQMSTAGVAVKWQLVTEIPMLKPELEENLLNRINKLVPFL